jgi:para-aminobenzoate synthetase component 1
LEYQKAYELVQKNIQAGNTYLTNLTFPTALTMPWTLREIYNMAAANYKLWIRDKFVVFSPEPFVKIANGQISTFPMKGTIDGSIPGAREILEADLKEKAEHATIVDLLRNDLNLVAERVGVERYRYFEKVHTGAGDLYQTSSHIRGVLPSNYQERLGDILFKLLPAGSVTGAPKKKTVEIIKSAEPFDRGYYTGVFGIFDGIKLESAVSIRFIEQQEKGLVYKSGGGITTFSKMEAEYQELLHKVYLPVTTTVGYEQRVVAIGNH